jgi:hypothetical protein
MTKPLIISINGEIDIHQTIFNLAKRIQELELEIFNLKISEKYGSDK